MLALNRPEGASVEDIQYHLYVLEKSKGAWGELTPRAQSHMRKLNGIAADPDLGIWDALILSVAAENSCRMLLTEDLQSGFTLRGVTVVNPFDASPSPLLAEVLEA